MKINLTRKGLDVVKKEFIVHHNAGEYWWDKTYHFETLEQVESHLKDIGEFATVETITFEK